MPIKIANNASGTLATAISASDTGIVLTTGDGAEFPTLAAGEYFYATITSSQGTQELVRVNARSGDSLTVVRAQGGTSAAGFAAGARFELRVTTQSIVDTVYDISRYQGASATNPTTRLNGEPLLTGDFYFNTGDNTLRFYNGSSWQSIVSGSITIQQFSGDGVTTAFTFSTAPSVEATTQVYINGVYQQKDTYTLVGAVLTFSQAPVSGTGNIEVVVIEAVTIGTLASSSVTHSPAATSLLTAVDVKNALDDLSHSSTGSTKIGFLQAGVDAQPRTVQAKLRDVVSVFDFMTAAQIADVQAGTALVDVTAAIQNAINSLASGGTVYMPQGTYYLASSLSLANNINIVGAGKTATILRIAANGITFTGQSFCRISDLRFTGTGGSPGVAIYFASGNTSNIVIENVYVALCANAIKNAPAALITVMQVIGCYFTDMNDWQVDLPAGTFNGLTFEDTRFENTTAAGGLRATNLQYSRFHGCIFESLAGSTGAVQLNNCQAYFHQCLFFNNARGITGGSDVYIGAGNQGVVHIYDCNFGPAASNATNHISVRKVVSINTLLRIENCYVNIDSVSDSFVSLSANPDSIYLITNKFAGSPASGQFVYRNNTLKGGDIKELSAINGGVAYSQNVDFIRCSIQTTDNITKSIWGGTTFGPISSYPAKDCYVLYEATVLCRESTGVDYGAWNIKELFKVVDAGSGNFTITSVSTAWSDTPIRSTASLVVGFGVTANNTANAGVELTVRGLAATTINWTANVKFTAVF